MTVKYPNRIRELRLARNLTQAQLGKQVGVQHATVNRHEHGNRGLDGFAIEKYSRVFGVSPYELFVPADHELDYDEEIDEGRLIIVEAQPVNSR